MATTDLTLIAKRKREEEKQKHERSNVGINKYFSNKPNAVAAKPKVCRSRLFRQCVTDLFLQPVATVEDNAWMADLLGEVDVNIQPQPRASLKTVKSTNRRKIRVLSPPIAEEKKLAMTDRDVSKAAVHALKTPPLEPDYQDDGILGNLDDDVFPPSDPIHSSTTATAADRKGQVAVKHEEEDEDLMEVAQAIGDHKVTSTSINISGSRPPRKVKKEPAYPTPVNSSPTRPPTTDVDASAWNDVNSKLNVVSHQEVQTASFGKLKIEDATESDGSVRMFWTDYTEVNGSLCLFGKVKDQKTGSYVSAFVKIDNIFRKLYFLPRTYRQSE